MLRYVLYSDEFGVYLGSFLGFGFWSKVDSAGQDAAVTFGSAKEAIEWAHTWETTLKDLKAIPVDCAGRSYATEKECVAAGISGWSR